MCVRVHIYCIILYHLHYNEVIQCDVVWSWEFFASIWYCVRWFEFLLKSKIVLTHAQIVSTSKWSLYRKKSYLWTYWTNILTSFLFWVGGKRPILPRIQNTKEANHWSRPTLSFRIWLKWQSTSVTLYIGTSKQANFINSQPKYGLRMLRKQSVTLFSSIFVWLGRVVRHTHWFWLEF